MISLEDAGKVVQNPAATDAQLEEVFRLFPTCHLDLLSREDVPDFLLELIANTSPSLEAQHQARLRLGITDEETAPATRPTVLPAEAYTQASPTEETLDAGASDMQSTDSYTPHIKERHQYRSRVLRTAVSPTHGPLPYEARLRQEQQNTSGALIVVLILLLVLIVALAFVGINFWYLPESVSFSFTSTVTSTITGITTVIR